MAINSLRKNELRTNEILNGRAAAAHSEAALAGVENGVFYHDPVMLKECLEGLNIKPSGTYSDCTLGGGGHSYAIANKLDENGTLHAFDRDEEAVAFATKRLAGVKPKFIVHPVRFGELKNEIAPDTLDGILYDLGISSHQVDASDRGFTFVGDNPLDLRMDRREGVSAQEWLKTVDADTLAAALRKNADMDRGFKLATRLVEMAASKGDQEILPSDVKAVVESVFPDKRREVNGLLARPKFAMVSTLAGAVANIILDPIFIYVFKWGMKGQQ